MCSLQSAVDAPGTTVSTWVPVARAGKSETNNKDIDNHDSGRLLVSVCFHPKVSRGPTVQTLLRALEQDEPVQTPIPSSLSKSVCVSPQTSHRRTGRFSRAPKALQTKLDAVLKHQTNPRAIGRLQFALSGIHLCSAQCSNTGGHSAVSLQEFAPVVRISFGDFVHEVRVGATDGDRVRFEYEWAVYSCFAHVEVEVLRRVSLTAGPVQRLRDGSQAVRVCGATIACHGIQERDAASWTFDPPALMLGPGQTRPLEGFAWHSLTAGDDDVGLAQIRAEYTEDFAAILSTDESADASNVYPDERSFDPTVVLRNVERLDDLFLSAKALMGKATEVLDWKSPVCTLAVWAGTSACLLYLPPALIPAFIALAFVALLLVTLGYFLAGHTHKKWIERVGGGCSSGRKAFRPVGTLRLVPVSAANLRTTDSGSSPDTSVRIFYEPNYKAVPVLLVAQTECARGTRDPIWPVAQPHSAATTSSTTDAFRRLNNRCMVALFRHLGTHEQDAVAHDVVEPWATADGTHVDTHAFKYPVLQPVQRSEASAPSSGASDDELTPWQSSPSAVRFDVVQENNVTAQPVLVGRVRVPLKWLVSDEAAGGPQAELRQTFPLIVPARVTAPAKGVGAESLDRPQSAQQPSLTVRMQLVLRDPRARVTLKETLASEALYTAVEMESQKELTLVEKYHKAKDVAKNIQQTLGSVCCAIERAKNLLLWVHPAKTLLVLAVAVAMTLWLYVVPVRYLLLYSVAKMVRTNTVCLSIGQAVAERLLFPVPNGHIVTCGNAPVHEEVPQDRRPGRDPPAEPALHRPERLGHATGERLICGVYVWCFVAPSRERLTPVGRCLWLSHVRSLRSTASRIKSSFA